jgi:hypothetical protein
MAILNIVEWKYKMEIPGSRTRISKIAGPDRTWINPGKIRVPKKSLDSVSGVDPEKSGSGYGPAPDSM